MSAPQHHLQVQLSAVADLLACPACLGELQLNADKLSCAQCGRSYAIIDGIPVLISNSPA